MLSYQLIVGFLAFYVVTPQEAEFYALRNIGDRSLLEVLLTAVKELGFEAAELAAGAEYGLEISPVEFEKEHECCQAVQPETHSHNLVQLIFRKILVEHEQVVAEIEECLVGI